MEPQKIQNNPGSQLIRFDKTDSFFQIFIFFFQDFLNWWYVKMPVRHLRILARLSVIVDDNLSISLLLKNIFVPWHRDYSMIGYFFGFFIKLFYLPVACAIYLTAMIFYIAIILIWFILPVATIVFTVTSIF